MALLKDRYELGSLLGTGGMARVVEGYDRVLHRRVAVKLMREDVTAEPKARERFLREARTAASFTHPNAVAVYDTGVEGRTPFIVMELLEGGTLAEELEARGPFAPDEALRITEQILSALAAAHRRGLVHRDVKPANVLLPGPDALGDGDPDRQVKLTDFGIAKGVREAAAGLTATGQVMGTPKYLSPEQVSGGDATPRSDVYAVGVLLYELLAGEPPFTGDNPLAVALAHQNEPVPPLDLRRPGLDPALVEFVHRALEKDPGRRFADADRMRAALASLSGAAAASTVPVGAAAATAVLPGEDVPAARPQPADQPAEARRGITPWLVVAAGALLLLAFAGFASSQSERDPFVTGPAISPTDGPAAPGPTDPAQAAPEAPAPPAAEPSPTPQATRPTDLPGLIALLSEDPEAYGEKGPDLLERLEKVDAERGANRGEEAQKTIEETRGWMNEGQLDPEIGELAIEILEPLAAQAPPGRDGQDGDDDEDAPSPTDRD